MVYRQLVLAVPRAVWPGRLEREATPVVTQRRQTQLPSTAVANVLGIALTLVYGLNICTGRLCAVVWGGGPATLLITLFDYVYV